MFLSFNYLHAASNIVESVIYVLYSLCELKLCPVLAMGVCGNAPCPPLNAIELRVVIWSEMVVSQFTDPEESSTKFVTESTNYIKLSKKITRRNR
jgi:hypothetical protein